MTGSSFGTSTIASAFPTRNPVPQIGQTGKPGLGGIGPNTGARVGTEVGTGSAVGLDDTVGTGSVGVDEGLGDRTGETGIEEGGTEGLSFTASISGVGTAEVDGIIDVDGADVEGLLDGVPVAQSQSSTSNWTTVHSVSLMKPLSPASCRAPQVTGSCWGKVSSTPGLVTRLPLSVPQMLHGGNPGLGGTGVFCADATSEKTDRLKITKAALKA